MKIKIFAFALFAATLIFSGCNQPSSPASNKTADQEVNQQGSYQESDINTSQDATPNISSENTMNNTENSTDNTSPVSSDNRTSSEEATTNEARVARPQTDAPQKGDMVAIMDTDLGTIKIRLFTSEVPEIAKNFMELARQGKYEGTPFHRVIKDFMIQTGDFEMKNGYGGYSYKGPGTKLEDEFNPLLKHLYGTVSMANSGPDTNGSQFFIVTNKKGTPHLDGVHSIFGQVYEGMEVVEKIQNLPTDASDKPTKPVNIKKVTIEEVK